MKLIVISATISSIISLIIVNHEDIGIFISCKVDDIKDFFKKSDE